MGELGMTNEEMGRETWMNGMDRIRGQTFSEALIDHDHDHDHDHDGADGAKDSPLTQYFCLVGANRGEQRVVGGSIPSFTEIIPNRSKG